MRCSHAMLLAAFGQFILPVWANIPTGADEGCATTAALLQRSSARKQGVEDGDGQTRCDSFFSNICGLDEDEVAEALSSWSGMSLAFQSCCVDGGHSKSTCSDLALEVFKDKEDPMREGDGILCHELVKLYETHKLWKSDGHVSLLNAGQGHSATLDAAASTKY
eukprot:gb/GFBE01012407.1/.p1 GENE.gb/GFBE01012407.1/~~gb/GFBE01012407.1/.p1  ORF type:complete len:164 (+),score=27.79 gb/GFBE01012407.1/:1-492(+)